MKYQPGLDEIASTGYLPTETVLIERSFEKYKNIPLSNDDRMFNGLMAVCDTLMQIHEATTEEITEAKQLFVKA